MEAGLRSKKADRSLRSHLWLAVCKTLHQRVQQIAQADPKSELIQHCVKARLLLPDLRWPALKWDHQKKEYTVSEIEPLTSQKLLTLCQALEDHAKEQDLVLSFHTLRHGRFSFPCVTKTHGACCCNYSISRCGN